MSRLRVIVRGRVQGVGFRWFVREAARGLDLAGYVLNRPDGSVEVEAEGTVEGIERLRGELEKGPTGAVVDSVAVIESTGSVLDRPFTIVR